MAERGGTKIDGFLHSYGQLASHSPDSHMTDSPTAASPQRKISGSARLRKPSPTAADSATPPDSSLRKRSYGMRDVPAESPTAQLVTETGSPANDTQDRRGSKRLRQSRSSAQSAGPSPHGSTSSGRRSNRLTRASPRRTPARDAKSRFLEGSMRDRESVRPPLNFLRHGDEVEEEPVPISAAKVLQSTPDTVGPAAGRQKSSMLRFGRALANAFNPATVLQSILGREKSSSPIKENDVILDERKAKAQKAYAELKMHKVRGTRQSSGGSSMRDSGIDIDSTERLSDDQKANAVTFDSSATTTAATTPTTPFHPQPLKSAPVQLFQTQPLSPGGAPSPERSHRRGRQSSLSRMKSHFSLKPLRRDDASPPAVSPAGPDSAYRVKKKVSKKELNRQLKLTKRISNLETQLQRARRELAESMCRPDVPDLQEGTESYELRDMDQSVPAISVNEAPLILGEDSDPERPLSESPVESQSSFSNIDAVYVPPRRFVPGALPSLPSARLLLPPDRMLPKTPEPAMASERSTEKLIRVVQGTGTLGLHSPMQAVTEANADIAAAPPSSQKAPSRTSSVLRSTRFAKPTSTGSGEADATAKQDTERWENADVQQKRLSRLGSINAHNTPPKYQFPDSASESGSDSNSSHASELSTPSNPSATQTRARRHKNTSASIKLRGGNTRSSSSLRRSSSRNRKGNFRQQSPKSTLSTCHSTASALNLADMATVTDAASMQDVTAGISAADLRSLYQSSSSAQTRRLRAIGPTASFRRSGNLPAANVVASDTAGSGTSTGGIARKRSQSPGPRGAARRRGKAITATPGAGDARGDVVPPLPVPAGAKVSEVFGGGEEKSRAGRERGWEGWGDDVF